MSAYKDSGIKWLGKIPAHWEISRIKHTFKERIELGFENETLLVSSQKMGVVPKNIYGNKTVEATKNLHLLKLVKVGDFVISLRSFQGGIEYAYYQGIISPAYTILEISNKKLLKDYFKHLAKSQSFIGLLQSHKTGIREGQNINYNELKEDYIPLPPLEEQKKIADFLDEKCKKIDDFVTKQTKFIELLKEQKQVLINQATTKGLNKSTELKDTHIPHLGKIPTHWEITKIGKVATQITDGSHFTPDYVDDGVPFISVKDISNGFIDFSDTKFISEKEYQDMKFRCNPEQGDLLLSKIGTICSPAIVETNKPFNIFVSVALLKLNTSIINNKYLYYLCYCNFVKKQALLNTEGVGNKNWVLVKIRETIIVLPPLEEQEKIAKYLDEKCEKIDKAIDNIERLIKLMQEYKTSLIDTTTKGMLKELK